MRLTKEDSRFWIFCYKLLHTPVTMTILLYGSLICIVTCISIDSNEFSTLAIIFLTSLSIVFLMSAISTFVVGDLPYGNGCLSGPPVSVNITPTTPIGPTTKILNYGDHAFFMFTATVTGLTPQHIQVSNQGSFAKDIRLDVKQEPGATKTYFVDTSKLLLGRLSVGPDVTLSNFRAFYYTLDHYCPSPAFRESIIQELMEEVTNLPTDRAVKILNQINSSREPTKTETWKQTVFTAFSGK